MIADALILQEDLTLALGQTSIDMPGPGRALVRIEFAGVCGSDLHVLRTGDWVTSWPAILGHEIVGIVESCPGSEFPYGQRVVIDSRVPCRACSGCTTAANLCEDLAWVGEILPGGYQQYGVFPVDLIHRCPPDLVPEVAVLAEPLAVAVHGVNRLAAIPKTALIIGYGPIGALVHSELNRRRPDCIISVREPDSNRRDLAQRRGAHVDPADGRWPLVIDAAGYRTSFADAVHATAHGGEILAIAIPHLPAEIDAQGLVERSITLRGSVGFDSELPVAVELLAAEPARYADVVTEKVRLDVAATRLAELSLRPSVGKVLIQL